MPQAPECRREWLVPDWPAPPNVRACVSLRRSPGLSLPPYDHCNLGSRCGDDAAAVASNRSLLAASLDLPSSPRWLQQVHGIEVARVDGIDAAIEPCADAAVTLRRGTVLAVLTADCLPVLLCRLDGSAVAAAHAGWRGLAAGVIEATCAALGTRGDALMAWLGPAIGPQSFEVGGEVRGAFVGAAAEAAAAFRPAAGDKWLADIYALARLRLRKAGIEAIYGGGLCTVGDPERFYSYRRDGVTGRMVTLIWRA